MRRLARADPMQPPAPVTKTILSELTSSRGLTGSQHSHGWLPVSARKTRSSTATERVKSVAAFVPGRATTERGSGRLRVGRSSVSRLERDARRFWRATCRANACVADENLAIAAIGGTGRGRFRLSGGFAGCVARRHREEGDEAPRRADRRQNTLGADQRTLRIGRYQLGGSRARVRIHAETSVA